MAKSRAMRKKDNFRVVSRVDVIKDGVRKAHSIRKFQDTYRVGLAYVGLLELDMNNNETRENKKVWSGSTTVDLQYTTVLVSIDVIGKIVNYNEAYIDNQYHRSREGYYYNTNDWDDHTEYTPEQIDVWRNNMSGITTCTFGYEVVYRVLRSDGSNSFETVYASESGLGYSSIEDCLDAIAQESETAWGDVTVYLNDNAQAYQKYHMTEAQYPDTVSLMLPSGESLELRLSDSYGTRRNGNWYGEKRFSEDNVIADVKVRIRAVVSNEDGFSDEGEDFTNYVNSYSADRSGNLEYYAVDVTGRIIDNNTQIVADRSSYERSEAWDRTFSGQGAQTLDGAVAIAESNIAEVYQEWVEFVNSARNYKSVGHGQGYRRTTENTEPWDYNFGDSAEDYEYEKWQEHDIIEDGPVSVPGTEWDREYGGWNSDGDAEVFMTEYLGDNDRRAMDYRGSSEGYLYFHESNWSVNVSRRNKIKEAKTQADVERVANYMGLKVIDYTDPLNFTLGKGVRKSVLKSLRKHVHYDVEARTLKSMQKQMRKSRSFTDMVNGIRKNNAKKRVI